MEDAETVSNRSHAIIAVDTKLTCVHAYRLTMQLSQGTNVCLSIVPPLVGPVFYGISARGPPQLPHGKMSTQRYLPWLYTDSISHSTATAKPINSINAAAHPYVCKSFSREAVVRMYCKKDIQLR